MKLTVVLNPDNKHRNALFLGNQLVAKADGGGLEDVSISWKEGKRAVLHIALTDFNVIVQNDCCPEAYRFNEIQKAFGDRPAMTALKPACEMVRISPSACDGCPKNPKKDVREHASSKSCASVG